ncbi:Arm DNA-binding domain-containing protein [uncultured Cohaesibacter sp.]|uniref:Arm DNA-binding domain-containing protein n=1 Tax=uncultured Cohaesibacter sp. TaxID=1002546 RepID=UPI0029C92CAD|nr:Arm DNA-binding domain-containing protein [uncultured Cohaesibacter sp.]
MIKIRQHKPLTTRDAIRATGEQVLNDGNGLLLATSATGGKVWISSGLKRNGDLSYAYIGRFPDTGLKAARHAARNHRTSNGLRAVSNPDMDAVDLKSVFELAGFKPGDVWADPLADVLTGGPAVEPEAGPEAGPDPVLETAGLNKQVPDHARGVVEVAAFRSSDGRVHATRTAAYEWEAKLLIEDITGARIVRSPHAVAEKLLAASGTLAALLAALLAEIAQEAA